MTPHHIVWHHITFYDDTSHFMTTHHILWHNITFHDATSHSRNAPLHPMIAHHILWRHTRSYDTISRPMTSYHILWRHTTPHGATSHLMTSHHVIHSPGSQPRRRRRDPGTRTRHSWRRSLAEPTVSDSRPLGAYRYTLWRHEWEGAGRCDVTGYVGFKCEMVNATLQPGAQISTHVATATAGSKWRHKRQIGD